MSPNLHLFNYPPCTSTLHSTTDPGPDCYKGVPTSRPYRDGMRKDVNLMITEVEACQAAVCWVWEEALRVRLLK